jgi:hypothetical protein
VLVTIAGMLMTMLIGAMAHITIMVTITAINIGMIITNIMMGITMGVMGTVAAVKVAQGDQVVAGMVVADTVNLS